MNKEERDKELADIELALKEFDTEGGRACLIVGSWDDAYPFYFKNDSYMRDVVVNILLLHKEHLRQHKSEVT